MNKRNQPMYMAGVSTVTMLMGPLASPRVPGLAKIVLGALFFGGIALIVIAAWRNHVIAAWRNHEDNHPRAGRRVPRSRQGKVQDLEP